MSRGVKRKRVTGSGQVTHGYYGAGWWMSSGVCGESSVVGEASSFVL